MTIVEFLEERIAEDEQIAKDTTQYQPIDEWDAIGVEDNDHPEIARQCWTVCEIATPRRTNQAARSLMTHIAHHDPARALREVAAKRKTIRSIEELVQHAYGYDSAGTVEKVLTPLAAIYSDHPDYRKEWATN